MTKRKVIQAQLSVLLVVLLIWLGWTWCVYHSTIWFAGGETAWQEDIGTLGLISPWLLMLGELFLGVKRRQGWMLTAGILVGVVYWLRSYQRTNQAIVMLIVPLGLLMCWVQTQAIIAHRMPTAKLTTLRRWFIGVIIVLGLISGFTRLSPTATVRGYLAGYSDPITAMATKLTFDHQPQVLTKRTRNYDVDTKSPKVITLLVLETQGAKGIELTLHQRGLWFYVTEFPWWVV